MSKKRIFLIVLDSMGIGGALDAKAFGDEGTNTLKSIAVHPNFKAPMLEKLGLFHIEGNGYGLTDVNPIGQYGRLQEKSQGKDTIIGHWELAGEVSAKAMPTFPNGFPADFIAAFEQATGRKTLCNLPYSGTELLKDYGAEHLETGKLIVYTSADSVFQIAAHEDVVSVETLYQYCEIARKMLVDDLAVGRVIARPFVGTVGNFTRTANRHDYALSPTKDTVLDALKAKGLDVIGVGKIYDIFNGRGITESIKSKNNQDGMAILTDLQGRGFHGLCFANLVDFDMVYGHRRDIAGYAQAVTDFDVFLSQFIENMDADDLLMITADHGCDPAFIQTTDHTREDVPLLMYSPDESQWSNLGTIYGFDYVADVIRKALLSTRI